MSFRGTYKYRQERDMAMSCNTTDNSQLDLKASRNRVIQRSHWSSLQKILHADSKISSLKAQSVPQSPQLFRQPVSTTDRGKGIWGIVKPLQTQHWPTAHRDVCPRVLATSTAAGVGTGLQLSAHCPVSRYAERRTWAALGNALLSITGSEPMGKERNHPGWWISCGHQKT